MARSFEEIYPNIAQWIERQGWIVIGQDEYSSSLVRCLDLGGMVWESRDEHITIDEALNALENDLVQLLEEYT
jgi:hypothetical protein